MAPPKTVQCSCGHVASGETAEELLAAVEAHIQLEHTPNRGGDREHAKATAKGNPARSSATRRRGTR